MIRAIPTSYKGIRFRSKLEANWAEFFDRHHIIWGYESQGFQVDGLWYLPDFWLPEIRTIVEVKGVLDNVSKQKVFALARNSVVHGIVTVLAEAPAGKQFWLVEPTPQQWRFHQLGGTEPDPPTLNDDVELMMCARCDGWSFVQGWGDGGYCLYCHYRAGEGGEATYFFMHRRGSVNNDDDFECSDCQGPVSHTFLDFPSFLESSEIRREYKIPDNYKPIRTTFHRDLKHKWRKLWELQRKR